MSDMTEIFDKVCEHFQDKSEYISALVKYKCRGEWWFDVEITRLLDKMGIKFEREKEYLPNKYVDFRLDLSDGLHFIELKALLHSPTSNLRGIGSAYHRLVEWRQGHKWLLMFAYPYSIESWEKWFSQTAGTFPKVQSTKIMDFSLFEDKKCTIILWKIE
jgi:hypothetical protein